MRTLLSNSALWLPVSVALGIVGGWIGVFYTLIFLLFRD
jgi:hypothetical protein